MPELLAGIRAIEAHKAIETEPAYPVTKLALRLLALTSVRSNEPRMMEWTEIDDLDGPEPLWRLPAERMKIGPRPPGPAVPAGF